MGALTLAERQRLTVMRRTSLDVTRAIRERSAGSAAFAGRAGARRWRRLAVALLGLAVTAVLVGGRPSLQVSFAPRGALVAWLMPRVE
jgi:hypothetical protein